MMSNTRVFYCHPGMCRIASRQSTCARAAHSDTLVAARRLAAIRLEHQQNLEPIYIDPYAASFCEEHDASLPDGLEEDGAFDDLATAFLDEQLLTAVSVVNMDLEQETRQVVLVGCGLDTRPYRLPWPGGTVIFDVAGADTHAVAASKLKEAGAHVPRACLLRRVAASLDGTASFADSVAAAGLRGDRLSVWALQGLPALGLDRQAMKAVLTDVANSAAFGSIVSGELPSMSCAQAQDLLAEFGLLGQVYSLQQLGDRAAKRDRLPSDRREHEADQRWLFLARCQQRSLQEMAIYASHVEAMEEAGEDFFGNFS